MSLAALIKKKGNTAPVSDAAPSSVLEAAFSFKPTPKTDQSSNAAPSSQGVKRTRPGRVEESSDEGSDEKDQRTGRPRRRIGAAAVGSDDEDNLIDDPSERKRQQREKRKVAQRSTIEAAPRTLFLGNVDIRTTLKELRDMFAGFGKVESARLRSLPVPRGKVPTKALVVKGTHVEAALRATCNAYVVFEDPSGVDAAMAAFEKLEPPFAEPHNGHRLRADRVGGVIGSSLPPAKGGELSTGKFDPARSVFVGNLPRTVTEDEVHTLFSAAGEVLAVRCVRDPNTKMGRGIAYVLFKDTGDAENGKLLTGTNVGGREIRVEAVKKETGADSKRRERAMAIAKTQAGVNAANERARGNHSGAPDPSTLGTGEEKKKKKPRHGETERKKRRRELAIARENGELPAANDDEEKGEKKGAKGNGAKGTAPKVAPAPSFGGTEAQAGVVPNLKRNQNRKVSTINKGTKRKESGDRLLKKKLRPTKPRN